MLAVKDVEASSAWYQRLLDCKSTHGGPHFDRLADGSTTLLLLHRQDAEEHEFLVSADQGSLGHGVCLYFYVKDLGAVYARAREMGANIVAEPHRNDLAGQQELELRDPDGYYITVCT